MFPALDPLRPLRHTRALVIGSIVTLVLVLVVGLLVAHAVAWDSRELLVLQWLSFHQTAALTAVALGIAWVFSPPIAVGITVLSGIAILAVTRNLSRALTFVLMVGLSYGGSEVLKHIVQRVRPDSGSFAHPLAFEPSFSFPSGHTTFAAAVGVAIVFLARDHLVRRIIAVSLAIIGAVLVAWSRMYLGVHYPTDVAAAIVYALASSALILVIWLGLILPRLRARR